ncbi:MAG: DNA polymerase III subunit delta [Clostridia bacterium]|nr:DNA polymerase III subunit delta [Clostridia bacterium]
MKYVDLKKFTDENGAKPVYLLEGEEGFFRERGEALLKTRFVGMPTLDYTSFDGSDLKGDKMRLIADALYAFPFASEKRMVRVAEFYPTEKEYETHLKGLFEAPPESGILVIVNSGKGKAGSAQLSKKPNVTHVDCGKSDEETIKKWIFYTCKKAGVAVDGVTAGKIAAYCVLDMSRIEKETEKLLLCCTATGQTRLTDELVDETVYPDSEYKIFELANALSRKNYAEFIKICKELQSKGFDEIALLSSLANYFKTLYELALVKGSDKEVAAALGMNEYAVKKNRAQAQKFSKKELFARYRQIYEAVCGIKSGTLTPKSALDQTVARLFF